jgi:hypothetical protein
VVELDATVWHVGVHPGKDVFYAPTQRCAPQGRMEFTEYVPSHFKNHLYEIEALEDSARVTRHLSIPKDLPAHLTCDVVVTDRQVIYNNPASSVISVADTSGSEPLRSRFAKGHSRGSARPPRPRDPARSRSLARSAPPTRP